MDVLEVIDEFIEICPDNLNDLDEVEGFESQKYKISVNDYLICYDIKMKDGKLYKVTIQIQEDVDDIATNE